ncbi:PPOX class F420-dependent oxidoreductase [Microlunatus antarcticus]|uniref:PPOX class probable F420-dependent enzyme n=1 Tax=Microlunatus antarcticus TaxID=53388 RepID=A0A7W5JTA5_9ACTN|nr:PPOX class probable F420-dependent enzyme [Microlunatus antarcticus]
MTAPTLSPLPDALLTLLRGTAPCFVATVMPDGSPQLTETWVDTDGEHVVINTVEGFQKVRNLRRDPRVSLNVCDPTDVSRYYEVRGHVVDITAEGGWEHIEQLSQRYTGGPYQNYGGRPSVRLIVTIAVDKVRSPY